MRYRPVQKRKYSYCVFTWGYNRRVIRRCCAAAALFILAGCSKPHASNVPQNVPSLPKLEMATYHPHFRTQVDKAYRAVLAKPADADANGNLGMRLEAFDQTESAEACYRRARYFDSKRFQWAYYLGLVQALKGKNSEAAANLKDAIRICTSPTLARTFFTRTMATLRSATSLEKPA